jgi:hypothetical protein
VTVRRQQPSADLVMSGRFSFGSYDDDDDDDANDDGKSEGAFDLHSDKRSDADHKGSSSAVTTTATRRNGNQELDERTSTTHTNHHDNDDDDDDEQRGSLYDFDDDFGGHAHVDNKRVDISLNKVSVVQQSARPEHGVEGDIETKVTFYTTGATGLNI